MFRFEDTEVGQSIAARRAAEFWEARHIGSYLQAQAAHKALSSYDEGSMGIRTSFLAGTNMTAGTGIGWQQLALGGLNLFGNWLTQRAGTQAPALPPATIPAPPGGTPQVVEAGAAGILGQLARYGAVIAGNIVRIGTRAWSRVPQSVKAAAAAAGIAVTVDSALDLFDGNGAGDGTMRKRRGQGISAAQLKGFHRVTNLLRKVGMHPKGLRRSTRRCKR